MFCGFCGKQLEDDAEFCPKCGRKLKGGSNFNVPNFDGVLKAGSDMVKSIDLQKVKDKSVSAVSSLGRAAKAGLSNGSVSSAQQYLYRIIISVVLALLFGIVAASSFSPKAVKCEVISASQPEQRGIRSPDGRGYAWLQDVTAVYKGMEWSQELRFNSEYETYHRGDSMTLYLSDGKLTTYKYGSRNAILGYFCVVVMLASGGTCIWSIIKYVKLGKKV